MNILIYPHLMEIGGSQLNAIELANGLAKAGHEVILFAPTGELMSSVHGFGLECVEAPVGGSWPSMRNMRLLNDVVRQRRIDVVHGFEWGPSVELLFGPHRTLGTPLVTTVLSMSVPHLLPTHEIMIVGTTELLESQQGLRPRSFLIEPPIDTELNKQTGGGQEHRENFGFADGDLVVSVVCRLTTDLGKVDGVLEAIAAVGDLADKYSVKLLVAGDGPGLEQVRDTAAQVNAAHHTQIVWVTGGLLDPLPAYSAADVVVGMGSSALKGMSFGKPVVVQGEFGFWKTLDNQSLPLFLNQGFFGHGGDGKDDLEAALEPLLNDSGLRAKLGDVGRRTVVGRYSLESAIRAHEKVYAMALEERPTAAEVSASLRRTAVETAKFKTLMSARAARANVNSRLRRRQSDNTKPLVAT